MLMPAELTFYAFTPFQSRYFYHCCILSQLNNQVSDAISGGGRYGRQRCYAEHRAELTSHANRDI